MEYKVFRPKNPQELQDTLNDISTSRHYRVLQVFHEPAGYVVVCQRRRTCELTIPESELEQAVRDRRATGDSVRAIARELGAAPSRVFRIIQKSRNT